MKVHLIMRVCSILLAVCLVPQLAVSVLSESPSQEVQESGTDTPTIMLDRNGELWYMPLRVSLRFLIEEKIAEIHKYKLYVTTDEIITDSRENRDIIWDYLYCHFQNALGVAGLMGNMRVESGFIANNLQNSFARRKGWNNASYTAAVDDGSYTRFVKDRAGYGLVQWTHWTCKQDLLEYAQEHKASIGDIYMQLDFLLYQLATSHKSVGDDIKSAKTIRQASDAMMLRFERPANQSESARQKRARQGQGVYDECIARIDIINEICAFVDSSLLNAQGQILHAQMAKQMDALISDIQLSVHGES